MLGLVRHQVSNLFGRQEKTAFTEVEVVFYVEEVFLTGFYFYHESSMAMVYWS